MATDEQLIQKIQQGESEAFGQLFSKYQKQIYSIVFRIVKNPHDAEEVVQDTFVRAYLKLDQLKKLDKFSAWLKRIAQNCSKNYLNRKQEESVPLVVATAQISTQTTPDRLLLKQELIDAVMEVIESLPQEDREMIQARIDGLSHSEISEQFGISISTSTTRLYRIRKKIKARVKDLLNAIIGLPKMLSLKKIISGGILAMKIGTSMKVPIAIIGVIIAGTIVFQVVMHYKTQQIEVKPPERVTQQQIARPTSQPKPVRQRSGDSEKIIQDEQDIKQLEEVLAWLDSLKEESSIESDESDVSPEIDEENNSDSEEERMRKIEAEIPILEQELRTILDRALEIHRLLTSRDGPETPLPLEVELHGKEMAAEELRLREKAVNKAGRYGALMEAVGKEPFALYPGGWIYESLLELWVLMDYRGPLQ